MARPRGTDGSLLASLPWTLAALALAMVPHVQFLPIWITAAFVACSAWRYAIERRRMLLPAIWFRALLALSCFLGVFVQYNVSISGVGPGSALLAIMAALKLLETRQRRDQFVLLFISIFLVMSSLLREQYLWSLPYLMVAVLLIMTAWLRMSATRTESAARSFRTSGRLVLYALPLAMAMWVFFPRIATPFWAVPIDTSSGTSGLSDTMSPGDISSLSLSDELAFRVTFDAVVPEPRDRYWRGLVLHRFNGRTWSGYEPMVGNNQREREKIIVSGDPNGYSVTLEPTRQQWVFALDIPYSWSLARTSMGREQQLSRVTPIDQRIVYEAISYPEYRTDVELRDASADWYLRLPQDSNPKTAELARQMYSAAGSDEKFIESVLRKFNQEEYFYTLQPPLLGNNPVDSFLFNTQQGFCEHYASAFAVMMRSVGIPARIVLGYQGGELNPKAGHLIVRQSDAHAWTEVWLPNRGWYRIDPTAAVAPERIESGRSGAMFDGIAASWGLSAPSALLYQLTLTVDALNAKWNEWILGYGPENQSKFMEWLGMDDPDWRNMMLTLIAIVVALIAIISGNLALRYRPPRKDAAAILYQKFTEKTGVEPSQGETPLSYAVRISDARTDIADAANSITAHYLDVRYGPPDLVAIETLKQSVYEFSRKH